MEVMKGRSLLLTSLMEKRWAIPLFLTSLFTLFIFTTLNMHLNSLFSIFPSKCSGELRHFLAPVYPNLSSDPPPESDVPCFAYLISGSNGDLERIWRTLHALYHPRNLYALHLDLESPVLDRIEIDRRVAGNRLFAKVGNVHVMTRSNMVTYRGPTMVANTLHACAILLKKKKKWDWFINLSASDYPLVTQDDLLSAFSKVPRNLNFVEHSSRLGWKEKQRASPLIIDPGLYMNNKSNVFWVSPNRKMPDAFTLFTGSAWMALSREFVEFCIWGWDNLPRILLMYYTNFISSPEGYFQTVVCNSPEFNETVINHDLHYISWDVPPRQHPHTLSLNDTDRMIRSRAPFARKFRKDDPVLDWIDEKLLRRRNGEVVAGGWCSGEPPCSDVGDEEMLMPGPGSKKLEKLLDLLLRYDVLKKKQCR